MSGYTKGPWNAFTQESFSGWWSVEDAEGQEVGSGDGGFYEEDARLISAAPDLLEALESLIGDDNGRDLILLGAITENQRRIAMKAIAKARGEK